ncbi:flocculation protein FLO11-like isoform X1 [Lytechinus variegatus]|uniref:flocculation protein FLO11-like isoform X1 n=1 Tax=Lytechinus variegatus TaxID=7654 RepID=UPI001BB237E6|nr:flocculation protein FLO11-like isoform X1 [Lytechinus variegatus]
MEEFDLHPQSPTSPQTQTDQFAAPASNDPFVLAGPPAKTQQAPAPSSDLNSAFGASDPFKVQQAAPTSAENSAPPAVTSTPSSDLFKEFKDTFTAPPTQQATNVFAGMAMGQTAPNPFGGMQTAPAPFQANFGGMGGMPAAFGGAPAAFGGAPSVYGAPRGFGAPPAPQQAADPFGGDAIFGDSVLTPEATAAAAALDNTKPAKSDPFSDIGALGSAKSDASKSTKDMFANYKIGKPGEAQPAPEIKLTGGPKRPPPAIPTSPQSSTCPAIIPPSDCNFEKPQSEVKGGFDMPSPKGPPPPLPPDIINIKRRGKPLAPIPEPDKEHDPHPSLPLPTNLPPPLPTYMNINDIHTSVPLPEINFDSKSPPPPPPPRSRPGQLRLSTSNPLPVPPRRRITSSQSSPPHSPHSETASIKSCDARFFSAAPPTSNSDRVSSPSIVSTCSALSTLDETLGEDSSGITSNSAPSHSNSMNSLSSVFDSNNVSTDTFDNESNTASLSPSPIASTLCHDNSASKAIDIIPSHFMSAPQPNGPGSTSQDSLYSSIETLSPSSTQSSHPSFTRNMSSSSHFTSSSMTVFSTSAPINNDSIMVKKSRSQQSLSPLTLPNLPVHDDPFADDPFSRHSPSVKKTFVLESFTDFSSSASTETTNHSQNIDDVWTSRTITNTNNELTSDVVINSDPFGAPVTNGNSGNNLFGNQFDTFDFSSN